MRILILLGLGLLCAPAFAQFSVVESDSSNRISIMGRNLNFNFFNLAITETDKMNEEGGRLATYSFLTASTYVNSDYRLALRIPFQYNTSGTDRYNGSKINKEEFFLQDLIVGLQNYDLLYLPADFELYWEGRWYFPTSPSSRAAKTIGRFRNEFILSRHLGRHFEFEAGNQYSYFFQSNSAYRVSGVDEEGFAWEGTAATKRTEMENVVRLWSKLQPEIGLGYQVSANDTTYNRSVANNKDKPPERELSMGPQFRFPITSQANFILSYQDVVNRDENRAEFGRFLAKNTEFTLLSFIKF